LKAIKTAVTKYRLTEVERLDPIEIIVENYKIGQGKIIITCWDKSWVYSWFGMGENNLETFFQQCDNCYLAGKLSSSKQYEIDWDKIGEDCINAGFDEVPEGDGYSKESTDILTKLYGEDWQIGGLPQKVTSEYDYLLRVIKATKEGLRILAE